MTKGEELVNEFIECSESNGIYRQDSHAIKELEKKIDEEINKANQNGDLLKTYSLEDIRSALNERV